MIIEPLLISLGRFSLNARTRLFIPFILPESLLNRISGVDTPLGYSVSQGRCYVLVVASLSHITYFTVAACRPPFWGLLVGFFFSGVAVSMLSGQL